MLSYFEEILKDDPKEVEINEKIRKENEAFEATPEYRAHMERMHVLWKEQSAAFNEKHKRISARRIRHEETLTEEQKAEKERERVKWLEEKRKKEWEELDPEMKSMILKYRDFSDSEKRMFNRKKEDSKKGYEELPKSKFHEMKKEDMRDLERVLVQTSIDFLKERGIDYVDEIHWGIDGFIGSLRRGEWSIDSDSSIWFGGYEHDKNDKYGYRTFIDEYM